jgi:hypothetical protein
VNITDWLPCTTQPVREGWYDVEMIAMNGADEKLRRYYWRDGRFMLNDQDPWGAPIIVTQDRWRGCTEEQS